MLLTEATLRHMWPHGDSKIPGLIAGIVATAPDVLSKYGIDSPLVAAHLMAQISHEFGAGLEPEENLSYASPGRIAAVWPTRFNTASALPYVRNPRALGNKVYNGRMGNRLGSDDGYNFRGRGGAQTTGCEGYTKLAHKTGLDLIGHPNLVNGPEHFLESAVADFILCGCLPFAVKDDVRGVTHHLNGGYIGLAERTRWLGRWKIALAAESAARPKDGTLRYGDAGYEVKATQDRLAELGYPIGKAEGDFGVATRTQVLALQADRDLPTTGVVDDATRAALKTDLPKPVSEARETATVQDLREAGSDTIAQADTVSTLGRLKIAVGSFFGLGAGAQHLGLLDQAQTVADKAAQVHTIWDSVSGFVLPILSNTTVLFAGVALACVGFAVCHFAKKIKAARLADHRSGANMAR